ncbi:hypothetical protein Drorol1_Dr00005962 [Drosera rotundifolia]
MLKTKIFKFYVFLTSKARSKPRSLTWSSSPPEEELSQRIKAKLNAIEQKWLDWSLAKVVKQLRAYRLGQELEFREFMESVRRLRIVNITFDDAGNS